MKAKHKTELPAISEQMKAWSAALASEISDWPAVSTRPFFGFTALYRGKKLFGLLPQTRGFGSPDSLVFKLESRTPQVVKRLNKDFRIRPTVMKRARWFTFELATDADTADALDWLGRAYEAAGKRKPQK